MSHLRLRTLHVVREVGEVVVFEQNVLLVVEAYIARSWFKHEKNGSCLVFVQFSKYS